jgi:very-short-patch-repair endonuclease
VLHRTTRPFAIHRAQGIPVTTVTRTLIDVAASVSQESLELAVEDALRRRLTTEAMLRKSLGEEGGKGRPGSRALTALLDVRRGAHATDSSLEVRVLRALRGAGLPEPARQFWVADATGRRYRLDLAYPDAMLAIEVDGYRWHSGRAAWSRDAARRNAVAGLGWTVLNATQEDVDEGCQTLITTIRNFVGQLPLLG